MMDAIVIAGGIPLPGEPLYAYSNGDSKALIEVAGKPMVQWVLDALGDSKTVKNVIVVGLSSKSGLTCKKPLHYVSNQGRMLANIVAGVNQSLELNDKSEYIFIVSSDIPALKGEMVDWLAKTAMKTRDEMYYGVCPRDVMESRYPESKRTYTKLKDIQVCGADINIIHVNQVTQHLDTWEQLIGNRKSPLKQAAVIGWSIAFKYLTGQFTLQELVESVAERIGIKGRAIFWEHAEPCMDVDKPHQLEIMRADMEDQQRKLKAEQRKAAKAKSAVEETKPAKAKPKTK
ncbi:MAG: NTP transferase domain-containing protein [Anaerolineales bacterium]|nr:NTP transferase domain-containing protein [Anaerolineales bacterium]